MILMLSHLELMKKDLINSLLKAFAIPFLVILGFFTVWLLVSFDGKCTVVIDSWSCSYFEYLMTNGPWHLFIGLIGGGAAGLCTVISVFLVVWLPRLLRERKMG